MLGGRCRWWEFKCLVGGADDGNLNETYTKKATKCHHLNLTFDIMNITLCDGYNHICTLNVNVPRLIVCPTCLNSDVGRDLMTSTYAIKSMTFAVLPWVSCRDNQNVRCISAVRSNLWWTKYHRQHHQQQQTVTAAVVILKRQTTEYHLNLEVYNITPSEE